MHRAFFREAANAIFVTFAFVFRKIRILVLVPFPELGPQKCAAGHLRSSIPGRNFRAKNALS